MSNKTILALGADIKSRFLVGKGKDIHYGPVVDDLSVAENYEFFKKEICKAIKRFKPAIIACDLHPGYLSSEFGKSCNIKLQPIQHHHAHIGSVMFEHNLKEPVLGVSFDGTGYGSDGKMWGGEFLLVDKKGFKRLAHLKYRMMPGGDKVVHEPWRMALSILREKGANFIPNVQKENKNFVLSMIKKDINSPVSSSAGRTFDAAAALLGVCTYASYEAEGPIKLESMCDDKIKQIYPFGTIKNNGCNIIDTDGIFQGIVRDLRKKKHKVFIATVFHNSMAKIIVDTIKKLSKQLNIKTVALSGGVFQNNFLKTKIIKDLSASGLKVFTNTITPVNDLNIALGQYYVSSTACKG